MNTSLTRLCGYAGLIGACAMFAGDMLFYGQWGTGGDALKSSLDVVQRNTPQHLFLGGMTSIVGGLGYALGACHIYGQMSLRSGWLRACVAGGFLLIAIIATATHAVWGSFALTVATGGPRDSLVATYLSAYFLLGLFVGIPLSALLAVAIFRRQTNWPTWFGVISPGALYLILENADHLPAPLGAPIVGGAFNLAFAVFYGTSIIISRVKSGSFAPPT